MSDGTAAGTELVKDIARQPDRAASNVRRSAFTTSVVPSVHGL